MADFINTFQSLANDAPNVMITRTMYELAERNLAVGQFAKDYTLENYMGKVMRILRYKRFNLPVTQLVEGVTPDGNQLGFEFVDVPVEQWGIIAVLADVGMLTITHPILQIAMDRCALALTELMEREIANTLLATGTSVVYGNGGATVRSSIVNTGTPKTDRFTNATVLASIAALRGQGAPTWDGDLYGGVMQPQQELDLLGSDTTFQQASNFARVRKLENAEIGIWSGVQWVRGNFLPIYAGVAAPDTNAATATKARVAVADTGGSLTAGAYIVVVVARDITSDYERRISQNSAGLTVNTSITTGSVTVTAPSAASYVYDIYMTQPGLTVPYKVASRVAASSVTVITAVPSSTSPIAPTAPSSATEVFMGWIFGKDAFARVKLNGMSMQSYITPAGASDSDPLAQRRKVGTKMMFKSAIQDQAFLVRFETVSTYSAFLPTT